MPEDNVPEPPHMILRRVHHSHYGYGGQKQAAKDIGINASYYGDLLKGNRGISPQVALKLEKAGLGEAETWLWAQVQYDLWKLRQVQAEEKGEESSA
jgi:antitoxin HigA-1